VEFVETQLDLINKIGIITSGSNPVPRSSLSTIPVQGTGYFPNPLPFERPAVG
jgi:hypothetical protein